ncbi:nucleotidyltransferase domain-containing protein, partial [Klebsiella variicola]
RLKKYFYVLRPLLAVRWIEAGKGAPPMRFVDLLDGTVDDPLLRDDIDVLLARKQRADEAGYGAAIPRIHAFIAAELARGEIPPDLPHSEKAQASLLDKLLYETVMA